MPLPTKIQNAPELLPGLELYAKAFSALTSSRAMGYGSIGAIPYAAIANYCREEGIDGEMREDLMYLVERMDAVYMRWQTEKAHSEQHKS